MRQVDKFYESMEEPNRSCFLALRKVILEQNPNVIETTKYGMPCFCYKQKMFCYLWMEKKTDQPYILMAEGSRLNHPCLEKGKRSRMKICRIAPNDDLPTDTIEILLIDALNLYRNGVIKI